MGVVDWLAAALVGVGLLCAGPLLIALLPTPESSTAKTHFTLSFLVSLMLLVIYWNVSASYGRQGFAYSDDESYHVQGQTLAQSQEGLTAALSGDDRNPGFVIWTAMLYRIFGPETIIIRLFNIWFRCLWIVPIAFLASLYNDGRTTRLAIALGAWAPSTILISLLHVKDVIASSAFLIAIAAIAWLGHTRFALWALAASVFLLWAVREDLLLLVVPLACIVVLRSLFRQGRKVAALGVLAAGGLFAFIVIPMLMDSWILTVAGTDVFTQIFEYTSQNADGAHGLAPLFIRSGGELWKLPLSMTAVLVLPFPPDLHGADIFSIANGFASLFVLALLPFTFAGCLTSIRKWAMPSLPVYGGFLGCAALLALVFPGTSRYREQLIGLFCLLTALGICNWRSHRALISATAFGICCALAAGIVIYL